MPYQLSRLVAGPVLRAYGRPRLLGGACVPASGPAILASSHLSVIDSVYVPLLLDRQVTFPANAEYFTARGPAGRHGLRTCARPASWQSTGTTAAPRKRHSTRR